MAHEPHVGVNGAFYWLTSDRANMNTVFRGCPEVIAGKYVAITTYDGGVLRLTERDNLTGWESRRGIAYSRQIQTVADLPDCAMMEPPELYQEWYVFETPADLGEMIFGDIFATPPAPGRTMNFINYGGFHLHEPEQRVITDPFWKQLGILQPESYLAEGQEYFTFVTRNGSIFECAVKAVKASD